MVNLNTVNLKFHLIRIFFYHFPNISCLKCTVNSNFHLIRRKTLPMNDFELTIPDLYITVFHTFDTSDMPFDLLLIVQYLALLTHLTSKESFDLQCRF